MKAYSERYFLFSPPSLISPIFRMNYSFSVPVVYFSSLLDTHILVSGWLVSLFKFYFWTFLCWSLFPVTAVTCDVVPFPTPACSKFGSFVILIKHVRLCLTLKNEEKQPLTGIGRIHSLWVSIPYSLFFLCYFCIPVVLKHQRLFSLHFMDVWCI